MNHADRASQGSTDADQFLDAGGLTCPMPLLKTKLALNKLEAGSRLRVRATDAGSARDIPAFLKQSSHRLLSVSEEEGGYLFLIERG